MDKFLLCANVAGIAGWTLFLCLLARVQWVYEVAIFGVVLVMLISLVGPPIHEALAGTPYFYPLLGAFIFTPYVAAIGLRTLEKRREK